MISTSQAPEIRKGGSVKTPKIDCEYLTSDREYSVKKVFIDGTFLIKDDAGKNIFCKILECGHLEGMNWILNN